MIALLCNHEFDPSEFEDFKSDYAGYCPACMKKIEDEDRHLDVEDDPDGSGVPEFEGSFDDEEGESALDDYEEQEIEEDPEENDQLPPLDPAQIPVIPFGIVESISISRGDPVDCVQVEQQRIQVEKDALKGIDDWNRSIALAIPVAALKPISEEEWKRAYLPVNNNGR